MGSGYFQVNELYTQKKTGSTSICLHTTQAKLYILDNVKNNNGSGLYFSSGCIYKYIFIPGRYLIFISKIQPLKP